MDPRKMHPLKADDIISRGPSLPPIGRTCEFSAHTTNKVNKEKKTYTFDSILIEGALFLVHWLHQCYW